MNEVERRLKFTNLAASGDFKGVARMLKAGFVPTRAALANAAAAGQEAVVDLLLSAGKYTVEDHNIALLHAVNYNQTKIARRLLQLGTDPNAGAGHQLYRPVLLVAAENGFVEFVRILLEHGAHPDAHDFPVCADLLGVDINQTALMAAAVNGRAEIVRVLLEAGADPLIKGIKEKTVYELVAKRKDRQEIAKLLQAWEKKKPSARQKAPKPKTDIPSPSSNRNDAVEILEKLLETKCTAHPKKKNIRVFSLAAGRVRKITQGKAFQALSARDYHQVLAIAREKCVSTEGSLFLSFDGSTAELCVAPWKDKFKVIAALKTGSANYGVETKELIAILKKVDALCPFDLCECGIDSVAGSFRAPVKDAKKFTALLVDICPFVLEEHSGKPLKFEQALRKERRFKLWWD